MKLTSTSQVASGGVNILVHGQAGAGKTRLCATLEAPIILSAESGLLSLKDYDIPVIEIASLDDMTEAYKFLSRSAEANAYASVCLDSLSEIAEICLAKEKADCKDPRMAYGNMAERMAGMVRKFRDLPKTTYFSAKQEKAKDEGTGAMLYAPSMPGNKLGQQIPYFFDEVFALRAERDDDGNIRRYLQTASDYQYTAKDRSGALALYEKPDLQSAILKMTRQTKPTNGN